MKPDVKILIIQTAFLGDVILTLPLVQTIRNHLQQAVIDFLCIPGTADVLKNHPGINQIIIYDKKNSDQIDGFLLTVSQIRDNKYDVVISPHRSLRSTLLAYYSKAPQRIGFDISSLSFLYTDRVRYRKDIHEIQRNNELAKVLLGGIYSGNKISLKSELYPSDIDMKYVDSLVNGKNFIVLAPCSRWYTKQLTQDKASAVIELLSGFKHNIIIIGGARDRDYCKELEKKHGDKIYMNLATKLTPLQAYYLISKSRLLVTVDSAALHLGVAANARIILIYGSTDRSFGFFPLTGKNVIIENTALECRPCTDHGRDFCPRKHFKCINEINEQDILKAAEMLLSDLSL